jgi:hypothetical protein
MGAGVNVKRTFKGRYRNIDEATEEVAKGPVIRVREMAASNAVTSLELFERLSARFGEGVSALATDHYDAIYVARRGGWVVVFDADHHLLQFVGRHMVLSAVKRERTILNRLAQKWLMASMRPTEEHSNARRIELFHPRCLAVARRNNRFVLAREDAFNPQSLPCDLLWIMSFSSSLPNDNVAAQFLHSACHNIVEGGLLVAGDHRDLNEEPSATIFRRLSGRLISLRDLGAGYEKKSAALSLSLD